MPFVVDTSIVAAWLLADERSPQTETLLDRTIVDYAIVPDLLWHEIRNVVLNAIRRGRMAETDLEPTLNFLYSLGLRDAGAGDGAFVIRLANRRQLSSYDATYLALALIRQLPLASLDHALRKAARAEQLVVLPDPI